MSGMGLRQARTGRQLVSCLVAYAFALQIVLFGFAPPPVGARAADAEMVAAGLCLHDAGAPLAPADNSGANEHCKFCTAGVHQTFTAPAMAHHAVVRVAEAAARPAADPLTCRPPMHAAAQPRGPPPIA